VVNAVGDGMSEIDDLKAVIREIDAALCNYCNTVDETWSDHVPSSWDEASKARFDELCAAYNRWHERSPVPGAISMARELTAVGDGMTDWNEVMKEYGGARPDDNDMVQITRGTARLARSALKAQNETDYYHNFGAAERELLTALGETREK
jgi:hypothetical protein